MLRFIVVCVLVTDEVVQRLWVVWASQRHAAAWEGVGPAALVALLVRADVHCTLLLLQHAACRQLLGEGAAHRRSAVITIIHERYNIIFNGLLA